METVSIAMHHLIAESQSRHTHVGCIGKSLAIPGRNEVPPGFNRLAHVDFAVLSEADPEIEWDDYCPAYALGLLTYEAYSRETRGASSAQLQAQWNELRGTSRLRWDQVRAIIARSWNALTSMEREGQL